MLVSMVSSESVSMRADSSLLHRGQKDGPASVVVWLVGDDVVPLVGRGHNLSKNWSVSIMQAPVLLVVARRSCGHSRVDVGLAHGRWRQ